jgi:prophage antirepressor-like protein
VKTTGTRFSEQSRLITSPVAFTTSTVQLFNFNDSEVRVVQIEGNPWFVATDVAFLLFGYTTGLVSVYSRLDTDEQRIITRSEGFGFSLFANTKAPKMRLISESGLYKLVMRSDKQEAKSFQDWVTKVVLPAIRKDGGSVGCICRVFSTTPPPDPSGSPHARYHEMKPRYPQ